MTNRDLFNKHLRKKVEDQLRYFESLSDEQLVCCNTQIAVSINTALRHFKDDESKCIGSDADILTWLANTSDESSESDSELWVPNEGDIIVEYYNNRWHGKFARVVSADRQNNAVLLDRYHVSPDARQSPTVQDENFALCLKFFHTPLESPSKFSLSLLQKGGFDPNTRYALANRKQLEICCKALSKTKELSQNADYAEFYRLSHLSADVLDWHIDEFNNTDSISNKTLEMLNLLLKTKK